jgi:hypothetical protein
MAAQSPAFGSVDHCALHPTPGQKSGDEVTRRFFARIQSPELLPDFPAAKIHGRKGTQTENALLKKKPHPLVSLSREYSALKQTNSFVKTEWIRKVRDENAQASTACNSRVWWGCPAAYQRRASE